MFSILIVFGGMLLLNNAAKTAVTAVAISVPLGLLKKNKEHERNMRLGINSEFDKHQDFIKAELMKNGIPPMEDTTFELFEFEADQLPKSMHWLLKKQFVLTESELFNLQARVLREMLDRGEGPFADETKKICSEYKMDYEELASHIRALSGRLDYEELIWLSKNRLADTTIRKKLFNNG